MIQKGVFKIYSFNNINIPIQKDMKTAKKSMSQI